LKNHEEKMISKLSDDIGIVVNEMKNAERHSNVYLEKHLREEMVMKKQMNSSHNKELEEKVNSSEIERNIAQNRLNHLKTQLEQAKKTLESLNSKKNSKPEESKTFLASEKLATTKKGSSIEPPGKIETPRKQKKK
jgi:hypothetical protein